MALEQYETFFCTGEEQYFHHRISGDRRQSQEWEKIKKKMVQLQEAHLLA